MYFPNPLFLYFICLTHPTIKDTADPAAQTDTTNSDTPSLSFSNSGNSIPKSGATRTTTGIIPEKKDFHLRAKPFPVELNNQFGSFIKLLCILFCHRRPFHRPGILQALFLEFLQNHFSQD